MAELNRRRRRVPVAEIPVVGIPAAAKTAAHLQVPQKAKVPRGASGLPAWAINWRFARAGSPAARPTRSQTAPRRMKTHDNMTKGGRRRCFPGIEDRSMSRKTQDSGHG